MAQLKDTLIQGSARVTDTLYTSVTQTDVLKPQIIEGGQMTAPLSWKDNTALPEKDSSAAYFLAIDAFADGGKTYWVSKANTASALGLGASGTHADSYFVKAISSTDNRLVRFDGNSGQIQGSRILVTDEGYIKSYNSTRWTLDWYFYHPGASKQVAELYFDSGDATNITTGKLYFRQYSPTSTASNTPTSYHETYSLPTVTKDRTSHGTYDILTTKNTITTAQGGTGVTSHTANRLVWSTSATAIQAGYHYANTTKVAINYMSEPTTNFYVGGNAMVNGATAASTTTQSGQLILKSGTGSNAVALEFYRNSSASWQILNTSGDLLFNNNYGGDGAAQTTYKHKAVTLSYLTSNVGLEASLVFNNKSAIKHIEFTRTSANNGPSYICYPEAGQLAIGFTTGYENTIALFDGKTSMRPGKTNAYSSGDFAYDWKYVYTRGIRGLTTVSIGTYDSNHTVTTTARFTGTAFLPGVDSGNRDIGSVTLPWANIYSKNLHSSTGIIVTSGGVWVQGGSAAGSNNTRMALTSGMPDKLPYNSNKRGVFIYSNAIAFADPLNGNGNNDAGWIRHLEETANAGLLEIAVGDDNANEQVVVRRYNTSSTVAKEIKLFDTSGNSTFPGSVTATNGFVGNLTGAASKLGTATVGSANRGIYLNAGIPTALTWYHDYVTVTSGNTNNYPWHRVATTNLGTSSWVDRDAILFIQSRYNGGSFGVIKISARANNATTSPPQATAVSATWMVRYGFAVGDVRIARKGASGQSAQCDVYVKCVSYMRAYAYLLEGANNAWTLLSSNEVNNTTVDDKKASIEVYPDVTTSIGAIAYDNVTIALDGGTVNRANYADTAQAATAATNSTNLRNFKVTTTTNLGIDGNGPGTNAIGYVSGLTKAAWNYQQNDGALISQWYNNSWMTEIFQDYRTGQLSVRGKNNGTWQSWRRILDETNGATILGLSNYRLNTQPHSGAWFTGTPVVDSDGVTEIGKYIDFHSTNAGTSDYDARITATTSGLTLSGTTTGTFSGNLTGNVTGTVSGNAGSATKLANARTLWGQSFNGTANVTGNMTNVGPAMTLPSGQATFGFYKSDTSAANAHFGRLGLNSTYANIDITNYVLDANGASRFGGKVTINHATPTYAFSISNSEKASIEYNSTNHVLNFIVT